MRTIGKALIDFFALYVSDSVDFMPMLFFLLCFYVNTFLYLKDFYYLVRKKSGAETLALLSVPLIVSAAGTMFLLLVYRVPSVGEILPFYKALDSSALHVGLGLFAACYLLLWGIWQYLQRNRAGKERRSHVLSCIPDFGAAAVIFLCLFLRLFLNENPFLFFPKIVLWLYLYLVEFFCCRVILLAVCLAVRIYSVRIPIRWKFGTSAPRFLCVYYLFCQNAVLRNVLLFAAVCVGVPTGALLLEQVNAESILLSMLLWGCGAVIILMGMKPGMKGVKRFDLWGGKEVKEVFCREYFLQPPVYRDENVTVTRHFLVDEQCPAAVYYWPAAARTEGWHLNRKTRPGMVVPADGSRQPAGTDSWIPGYKGWIRTLTFLDGTQCTFTWNEKASAEEVFAYARQWTGRQETPESSREKPLYTGQMVAAKLEEERRRQMRRVERLQPLILAAAFAVWFIMELLEGL